MGFKAHTLYLLFVLLEEMKKEKRNTHTHTHTHAPWIKLGFVLTCACGTDRVKMIYFWGCLVVWKETFLVTESSRLCPQSESVPAAKKWNTLQLGAAWCNITWSSKCNMHSISYHNMYHGQRIVKTNHPCLCLFTSFSMFSATQCNITQCHKCNMHSMLVITCDMDRG